MASRETTRDEGDGAMGRIPRLTWTITFGQVIQIVLMAGGYGGGLWLFAQKQAAIEMNIVQMQSDRVKYIPIIEQMMLANSIQDERIQAQSLAIGDIRKTNGEMLLVLGNIREQLAVLNSRRGP